MLYATHTGDGAVIEADTGSNLLIHGVSILQVCCSVLQCIAVCCSVLQCVAVCCSD